MLTDCFLHALTVCVLAAEKPLAPLVKENKHD